MSRLTSRSAATSPKRTLLVTAIFAALMAQSSVFAQTEQDTDQSAADSEGMIEEVVVMGVRHSLDSAAEIKRNSDQLVDAISAEDIGMFSDNNIAEALQRVPGVQVERDMGEGFRISIRGLGPRFVRTTVNGRTALSTAGGEDGSGEDSRGFTLNMMPSEVISRVTVEKSTQAKNLEGGLGGTLDHADRPAGGFCQQARQGLLYLRRRQGGLQRPGGRYGVPGIVVYELENRRQLWLLLGGCSGRHRPNGLRRRIRGLPGSVS